MKTRWSVRSFDELAPIMIHAMYKLRVDVFVVEQTCIYPEVDDGDLSARHVFGLDASGDLVAYARILAPGNDGLPHIGRVIVRQDSRGRGLAHELMSVVLSEVQAMTRSTRAALAAQVHLQAFYEQHGFVASGATYDLDGIPHVDMVRDP